MPRNDPAYRRYGRKHYLFVGVVFLTLAGAACGSSPGVTRSATSTSMVLVSRSAHGVLLVNSDGRTLYAFTADHGSRIVCGVTCTPIWPPLTVRRGEAPTKASGLSGALGTIIRSDGSHQVTYNGLPLYTYTGDSGPGQTNGQGIVEQYGSTKGTWFAVTPTSMSTATSSTTTVPTPATVAVPNAPATSSTQPAPPSTQATTTPTVAPPPRTTQAPATTAPAPPTTMAGGWG